MRCSSDATDARIRVAIPGGMALFWESPSAASTPPGKPCRRLSPLAVARLLKLQNSSSK